MRSGLVIEIRVRNECTAKKAQEVEGVVGQLQEAGGAMRSGLIKEIQSQE